MKISHLVQPLLVCSTPGLHQQTRDPVLHLHHLPYQQMPVAQGATPISNLRRDHVTLRQEIAAKTVSDLSGVDLVVLLLGRCNRPQHQGVSYLDLLRMRKQMVVDPASKDRRFHGNRSRLGKGLDPAVQFAPCRSDLAFLKHLASRILAQ
jgi:hypothetical protein